MKLDIFSKSDFETQTMINGVDAITSENIFELLTSYSHLRKKGLTVDTMYSLLYKKPFALYSIDTSGENREPYNLIGYSYGTKYNRADENIPLIPKVFYIDINNKILEIIFYKDNTIVQFVKTKNMGRDSYYISYSDSKYIVHGDKKDIIYEVLGNKPNIYVGSTPFSFTLDGLGFEDKIKLVNIREMFSRITGFNQNYAYRTFQKVSLNDILHHTDQLFKIWKNEIMNPVTINDTDKISNTWKKGGYILPL